MSNQGSLENIVTGYLRSLVAGVLTRIGSTVHGHAQSLRERKFGEIEGEIIARAGDMIHTFKVSVSLDRLNVFGIVDYTSFGADGKKGRSHSKAFELPATAHPGHFVEQMAAFAEAQYQGHNAPASVEWTYAS